MTAECGYSAQPHVIFGLKILLRNTTNLCYTWTASRFTRGFAPFESRVLCIPFPAKRGNALVTASLFLPLVTSQTCLKLKKRRRTPEGLRRRVYVRERAYRRRVPYAAVAPLMAV